MDEFLCRVWGFSVVDFLRVWVWYLMDFDGCEVGRRISVGMEPIRSAHADKREVTFTYTYCLTLLLLVILHSFTLFYMFMTLYIIYCAVACVF